MNQRVAAGRLPSERDAADAVSRLLNEAAE
jgi:hypothetical protein